MRRAFGLTTALLLVSCAGVGTRFDPPNCPVVPSSRSDLPDDLDLRARMNFKIDDRDVHLDVLARSSPGELVVVGIASYGVRVFAAQQRGRRIAVSDAATREFEHLARWTMDALHRSVWIQAPPDAGWGPVVRWSWENENVTESVQAGEARREFSRIGASTPVLVQYREHVIEIRNPWCGYHAVFAVVDDVGEEGTLP